MKYKNENRKHIKKFKSANFDYAKYVREFFVEDGKAYVSVKVDSIDDIISEYSIKDYEWLNSDFVSYIEENAYYIPVHYPIVIEIFGYEFTESEKIMITKVIKDYFGLKLGERIIELKMNKRKAITLLLFGLVTLVISFILSSFDRISMLFELVLIIAWFSIWEFVDYGWLEGQQMKKDKLEAGQLASVEVKFSSK
jgi:hypothetical protein